MHFRVVQIPKIVYLAASLLSLGGCENKSGPVSLESPVPADRAVSTMQLPPGFKIELIAAEPLVADPVAMEIDEHGNLYVVENHGYPLDKTKSSKVKLLRDTDGDGRMDRSTIFADTLLMPTGVMRWKNGILVTDAPDVLYMEDTDGDDKADIITRMLTGFALSNPQHNVNNPIYGLDNWIYIAHERAVGSEVYKEEFGDRGSDIFFLDRPSGVRLPENANGRNVRVKPDTYELEMLASTTQFGHTFDEWGNYFLANNSNHLMHSVVEAAYLNRNPDLIAPRSTSFIPDHGNAAEVFPITATPDRQLLTDVGVMTSACGVVAYTGGAFPGDYNAGVAFVAEPVSNIVHADRLRSDGSTFVASRLFQDKEFLASTDMWSRPVNLYIGPDGALYVVDYYREIIEHPEWLSDDVITSGNLYNGHDMGRIFRISRQDAPRADWTAGLDAGNAPASVLVEKLSHSNLWWRRTAQRLLVDRKLAETEPLLNAMATGHGSPLARLHALWTLHGMGKLSAGVIAGALRDGEAGVRMNAVRLAELQMEESPELNESLLDLQDDPDARVRFQLLCTLGSLTSEEAATVREKLLFQDIEDEFVQIAALSARSANAERLLRSALSRYDAHQPAYDNLVTNLSAMIAMGKMPRGRYALIRQATRPERGDTVSWQVAVLKGLARSFSNRRTTLTTEEQAVLCEAFFENGSRPLAQGALKVLQAAQVVPNRQLIESRKKALDIARDTGAQEMQRAMAIDFLALHNPAADSSFLKSLVIESTPIPAQLAALRALNAVPGETITNLVMENWEALSPALKDAALNALMDNERRMRVLLEALEAGKVEPTTVGWQRSIRLMTQRNIELRNRARTFFATDDRRQKVVDEYQPALTLKGDAARGRDVYQRSCAICHQIRSKDGIPFGPDLGTVQSWPPSGIMENIIDPNQSISHGYDLWNVVLTNGESLQGVITAETSSAVTIRNASGQSNTIARADIASQKALNMSAMPVGLEKDISHQDMADLLVFLRGGK